eukprot:8009947-Prorocentrum_lima.AAC.1
MTSSLVGSEMCIRDSNENTRTKQERYVYTGSNRKTPTQRDAAQEGEKRPVSYTHLTLPTICSV